MLLVIKEQKILYVKGSHLGNSITSGNFFINAPRTNSEIYFKNKNQQTTDFLPHKHVKAIAEKFKQR